jgi:hypothetical protein
VKREQSEVLKIIFPGAALTAHVTRDLPRTAPLPSWSAIVAASEQPKAR